MTDIIKHFAMDLRTYADLHARGNLRFQPDPETARAVADWIDSRLVPSHPPVGPEPQSILATLDQLRADALHYAKEAERAKNEASVQEAIARTHQQTTYEQRDAIDRICERRQALAAKVEAWKCWGENLENWLKSVVAKAPSDLHIAIGDKETLDRIIGSPLRNLISGEDDRKEIP